MAKLTKKTKYTLMLTEAEKSDIELLLYIALHPDGSENKWIPEYEEKFRKLYETFND